MKKSKVIIPALGVLILSTAASVTGTVAWFTASRTYNTTIGEFAVVKTNADLKCTLAAGLGTFKSEEVITLQNASTYSELTDASFDHVTASHDIYAPDATGAKIAKKVALASATADDNATTGILRGSYSTTGPITHNIYSAVTWTMTFSVSFGATGGDVALMMDHTAAHSSVEYWNGSAWTAFTAATGSESGAALQNNTARGFRLAMIPTDTTNGVVRVWADGEIASNCKHTLNAAVDTALSAAACNTAYESPFLIDQTVGSALPDDGSAISVFTARNDYLGKIPFTANTVIEKTYTCVAWYEGSDPFIINQNASTGYQKVRANMFFEIKNIGA